MHTIVLSFLLVALWLMEEEKQMAHIKYHIHSRSIHKAIGIGIIREGTRELQYGRSLLSEVKSSFSFAVELFI